MRELLLLHLRNAIVDKEWVVACANRDTASGGWTGDWNTEMDKAEAAVQYAVEQIHKYS
jgi:thiamine phosphate synthase YjbQ (UPF0047 family)